MSKDPIASGIKSILSERGFKQRCIAERAGYSEQQFSDMLNDRKTIKATDIMPIARALGGSVQDIYDAGARYIDACAREYIG